MAKVCKYCGKHPNSTWGALFGRLDGSCCRQALLEMVAYQSLLARDPVRYRGAMARAEAMVAGYERWGSITQLIVSEGTVLVYSDVDKSWTEMQRPNTLPVGIVQGTLSQRSKDK